MLNAKMSYEEVITSAKIKLRIKHLFFYSLISSLKLEFDESLPFDAATDGKHIFMKPSAIERWGINKTIGVWLHEIEHVIKRHHLRIGNRDVDLWNIAADKVINAHKIAGGFELPEEGIFDDTAYNRSVEDVYEDEKKEADKRPKCSWGVILPHPQDDGTDTAKGQIEQQLNVKIVQAAEFAKAMGQLPAEYEKLVEQITDSKIPWENRLRDFMTIPTKADSSWKRPNRRFVHQGLHLQSRDVEYHLDKCVIFCDTSGSMGVREMGETFAQINKVLEDTRPEKLYLVPWDTAPHGVLEFTPDDYPLDPNQVKLRGGGGTNFRHAFDWINENLDTDPLFAIFITDMCASFPANPPHYPVLWVDIYQNDPKSAPFGEYISIKE